MEQRIGSTSPPVPPAGIDPAFIPGLTPPVPAEGPSTDAAAPADVPPEDTAATPVAAPAAPAAAPARPADSPVRDTDDRDAADDGADGDEGDEGDEGDAAEPADDGLPVFEATDRRGAIVADREGVTFRLDDQEAEFGWDEIGAVEIDTPRFGRRFSVTVYTSARRWFQSDVEAPSRSVLKQWTAELDAVLDARFEDGDETEAEEAAEAVEGAAQTGSDDTASAGAEAAAEEDAATDDGAGSGTAGGKDTAAGAGTKG
ncbi:hypothetical protein [Actinacidiphila sp. ITFR-21]|uniref:hypothetical protein n=1 Tax=Actinacidiphila sp. ITFR-21 TaxID=3075199 RepID=UPI0028895BAD|nr:hypothetical protein [Streptomyces sp. ITFR-21]WNI16759.1 hypothetical protein RLT57_15380 [Streptomyces sp. ITFR-21]